MKFDAASPIADALDSTLEAFRSGDFARAEAEAEAALAIDFEDPGVQSALKCAVFWKDRAARAGALSVPESRAELYLREWLGFSNRFRAHLDEPFERGIEAIRGTVFAAAAQSYLDQIPFEDESRGPELRLKAARAWKEGLAFDKALDVLDDLLKTRPEDAAALAEMADCFDAIGESDKAKLYFREAFYLNAQAIDVDHLRSPAVKGINDQLTAEGLSEVERKEWLPVHAVIRDVFRVKRDLKPLELGQLKQSINALKAELHDGAGPRGLILPKLLNRYFWLIDHFLGVKEERSKIEDVLLNIKLLDERIYELYTQ